MRARALNQRLRIHLIQAGAVVASIGLLLVGPFWGGETHEVLQLAGIGLVLACVAGRMWSILYIGSHKNRQLTTLGPYSVTRNPLYLFSTIGAVGIGLMYGSLVVAALLGLISYAAFIATARKEADHLVTLFGERYAAYAAVTPMFWPKLSLYRDTEELSVSTHALRRTFLDALLFLAIIPLMELIERLHAGNHLPVFFRVI
ncbi:sodium:proton antiporter [Kaistia sp. 32K]|uniref:methyltransferase family protein n=1 Tax=Kaistia sp. 32K TaxID=2795690 RepID=UPI0019164DFD|nr:isoprenylcysteine carboxylmethyltransferase family protein [Kaistia sp. 32K]BCP53620.1 sodium:proton antiporter [Kaistia sp. 32K]